MVFGFGSKPEEEEEDIEEADFVEIPSEEEGRTRVTVRIENLNDYRDVETVQKLVRDGNIVFLKIKRLKERDLGELKRCVDRLRKTIVASNGDIIGIEEDFLVLTPNFARIYRGEG